MTSDPTEQLRQSRSIAIAAVLDLGQAGSVMDAIAPMSNPVAIPVRVEYQGASMQPTGPAPAHPRTVGGGPDGPGWPDPPDDQPDRADGTVAQPASSLVPPARRRRRDMTDEY